MSKGLSDGGRQRICRVLVRREKVIDRPCSRLTLHKSCQAASAGVSRDRYIFSFLAGVRTYHVGRFTVMR